ncbi:MAG: Tryptophan synthase alpha chain [Labilithrix sp.]|nr:Tryptophan synthase alpha chain [Labilithrix sp.]
MRPSRLLGLGFLMFSAACAASGRTQAVDPPPGQAPGENESAAEEDPATAPPHALGTIVLGETRTSSTGDSNPLISAAFVPDSKMAKSCSKKVGSCELTEIPKCTTGTMPGCGAGEVCTFDDDCEAKCVQTCTKSCAAGEACYFTSKVTSGTATEEDMACKKKDRFDAGAIAFAGTTQSITLFPPYSITPNGNGAPFMARSEIRVQATGGAAAGFEKFDEKFTSTTFLETNPPLRELSRSTVFGSGAVTIGWLPGEDTVYVIASGAGGSAKCAADDASGTFDLPRSIIREVTSGADGETSGALSIAVTRERREVRKDKKAFGELSGGQVVQPDGWVELITSSTETHSFTSCGVGADICGEQCVNLQSDTQNCGECGNACPASYYCSAGTCRY